jgi:hypothetical protein
MPAVRACRLTGRERGGRWSTQLRREMVCGIQPLALLIPGYACLPRWCSRPGGVVRFQISARDKVGHSTKKSTQFRRPDHEYQALMNFSELAHFLRHGAATL